jgi:hypothetical protein
LRLERHSPCYYKPLIHSKRSLGVVLDTYYLVELVTFVLYSIRGETSLRNT